ncbi:MAG TPA: iron-sulfur cluster assembly accessory protein [Terrimicrobiaceae bacterium]
MIELTANAAAQLRVLVEEKGLDTKTSGLRLLVEKGGCAGMQYAMSIGAPKTDDIIVERDDARLLVDADSLRWLDNCVIDYEDSLSGAGFRVSNPLSARSCGCGTSFEPADSARS